MRLLHTNKLEFEEFYDSQIPEYAVLSHRWIGREVSFQEFHEDEIQRSPRFEKIKDCCSLARERNYEWVWIDTCCIDKRNSAELTEAINSMYEWYNKAEVCFAYLADVTLLKEEDGKWRYRCEEFCNSKWFTRGWTLQELLAPREVVFLDRHWRVIGLKTTSNTPHTDLKEDISVATGIPWHDLRSITISGPRNIAKKMSWLSRRHTSRIEDMAYCMLGIFGVNMPLLYGEGSKAFLRLQLEIIKISDDESIFAWFLPVNEDLFASPRYGILASSPSAFARSGQVVTHRPMIGKKPFSVTNKGLQYKVPRPNSGRRLETHSAAVKHYSLLLDCGLKDKDRVHNENVAISLSLSRDDEGWWRTDCDKINLKYNIAWNKHAIKGCTFETLYININHDLYGRPSNRDEDDANSLDVQINEPPKKRISEVTQTAPAQ